MLLEPDPERTLRLRNCAAEIRASAETATDAVIRETLLKLVSDYEALANLYEPPMRED